MAMAKVVPIKVSGSGTAALSSRNTNCPELPESAMRSPTVKPEEEPNLVPSNHVKSGVSIRALPKAAELTVKNNR